MWRDGEGREGVLAPERTKTDFMTFVNGIGRFRHKSEWHLSMIMATHKRGCITMWINVD